MTSLDERERELVALGAAVASSCIPCIEHHVPETRKAGLSDERIAEALRLADELRRVPARKVLDAAIHLLAASPGACAPAASDAACGRSEDAASRCC